MFALRRLLLIRVMLHRQRIVLPVSAMMKPSKHRSSEYESEENNRMLGNGRNCVV